MRKLFKFAVLIPLAILLILLSVANRQTTVFSLDPLNQETPAIAFELPLFVYLFIALMLGMFIGSCLTWMSQGKHRRALREKSYEANQMKQAQSTENSTGPSNSGKEIAPGLPAVT